MTKRKPKLPPKQSPRAIEFYSSVATPPVFIDDRIGSRDLVEYPPLSLCGELMRLDSGDACFTGNGPDGPLLVGVELKSVTELISSMETGRLQGTQLPAMREQYGVVWLLYYGVYRPALDNGDLETLFVFNDTNPYHGRFYQHTLGRDRPVPYGYLEGFLMTLAATGIHVKHVADKREAAVWIGALARWWAKPWGRHSSLRKFDKSRDIVSKPGDDPDLILRANTARAWPGLDYHRAMAAARHFPSVAAMVAATREEWAEVPGVGKILSRAIVEAINKTANGGGT